MTLADVRRIMNHWQRVPPLRMMVAAVAASLGVKFPGLEPDQKITYTTGPELEALARSLDGRAMGRR